MLKYFDEVINYVSESVIRLLTNIFEKLACVNPFNYNDKEIYDGRVEDEIYTSKLDE